MEKILNMPDADANEHQFKKYDFENAKDFYDVLLNFNDMIGEISPDYNPALHGQRRWIFRGHWDSTWGLSPTAFRKESYEELVPKEIKKQHVFIEKNKNLRHATVMNQISVECSLLRQFMETANNLGIECNYTHSLYEYGEKLQHNALSNAPIDDQLLTEWANGDILPVMALARHHGLPTRLLDFSYNPLFAAFFAASRPFFKKCINDNKEIDNEGELCIWVISEKANFSTSLEKVYAPSNRSSNLFAQEGLLIIDTDANGNFIEDGEWKDFKNLIDSKYLIKLTLPQREYKDLLRHLWDSDITPARIMPNLDRATETLKYNQWLHG